MRVRDMKEGDHVVLPAQGGDGNMPDAPAQRCVVLEVERDHNVICVCIEPADRLGNDHDGLTEMPYDSEDSEFETW